MKIVNAVSICQVLSNYFDNRLKNQKMTFPIHQLDATKKVFCRFLIGARFLIEKLLREKNKIRHKHIIVKLTDSDKSSSSFKTLGHYADKKKINPEFK